MTVHDIKQVTALMPQTLTATTNGAVVDAKGFEALTFLIGIGDFATFSGTNNLTWKVQSGDAADLSDASDIPAGDYIAARYENGAAWDRINDAAADDEEHFAIGVRLGTKRYYRLVVTEVGTVSVPASAVAVLTRARHAPAVTTQAP